MLCFRVCQLCRLSGCIGSLLRRNAGIVRQCYRRRAFLLPIFAEIHLVQCHSCKIKALVGLILCVSYFLCRRHVFILFFKIQQRLCFVYKFIIGTFHGLFHCAGLVYIDHLRFGDC